MPNFQVQILIYLIQCLWVDPLSEHSMFFGPILEDELEIGTNSYGLLKQLLIIFVQKEFESIGRQHEIKYEVFVLRMVTIAANNISHLIRVLRNQLVCNVPIRFSDHIGQKNALDFVYEEYFGDSLQHFVDGVAKSNITAVRY